MAEFRDSFGRIVNTPDGMGAEEIKNLIKSLMTRPTQASEADNTLDQERNTTLDDIKKLLIKLNSTFDRQTSEIADYISDVASYTKKSSTAAVKPKADKVTMQFGKDIADLHKHGTRKGSIQTADYKLEKAVKGLARELRRNRQGQAYTAGFGGGGGGRSSNWRTARDPISKLKQSAFKGATGGMAAMLGGATVGNLFSGAIVNQVEFIKNMRQIGLQTSQITGETEALQNEWTKIGKTSAFTGKRRNEFEQQYLKNLKSGRLSQKETYKTTLASLNLSTMIGSSTEQTADLLNDWHVKMQVNSSDVSNIARGMQQVAQNTGVTGDKLVAAAASSQEFVKNMRDAGTLTSKAANAIIELQTRGQKMGVEGLMNPILKAISSTNALYNETSKGTQALIFQAAALGDVVGELQTGTLANTTKGMKGLANGMEQLFTRVTGVGIKEIHKLSDQEKMAANLILAQYGTSVNQLAVTIKEQKEAAKSFSEKIGDIQKDRQKDYLTTQQVMHLRKKQDDLEIAHGLSLASAFGSALEDSKTVQEAMSKMNQDQFSEMKDDYSKIGIGGSTDADFIEKAVLHTYNKMQEQAKANNVTLDISEADISSAFKGGAEQQRHLMETLTSEQQRITTAVAKNADPISRVEHVVNKLNDTVNDLTKAITLYIMGVLGPAGSALLAASYTSSFAAPLVSYFSEMLGLNKAAGAYGMTGAMGKAGGTAVEAAEGGGGGLLSSILGRLSLSGIAKATGVLAVLGTAVTAVYGAFTAGAHAADIFNTEQSKLTTTQVWAAEGAGLLTGALNFLTFGIFRKALGPTGTLTQSLAKLFDGFAPLAWLFQVILIPIKIVWGILKGLYYFVKEVLIGAWEGLMAALQPFGEIITSIKEVFNDVAATFSGMGGIFGENIGIVETLVTVLQGLGKMFGWVIKIIGGISGMIIRTLLLPIHLLIKVIGGAIKGVMYWLRPMLDGIIQFFSGIGGILTGLFSLDWEKIKNGFKDLVVGFLKFAVSAIAGFFLGIPMMIASAFYEGIVAIPDLLLRYFIDPIMNLLSAITFGWIKGAPDRTKKTSPPTDVPKMAIGSSNISGEGVAYLHKGEKVVPATSDGPYKFNENFKYQNDPSMGPANVAFALKNRALSLKERVATTKFYKTLTKTLKDSTQHARQFGAEMVGALKNKDMKLAYSLLSDSFNKIKNAAQPMLNVAKSGFLQTISRWATKFSPVVEGVGRAVNYLKTTATGQKIISGATWLGGKVTEYSKRGMDAIQAAKNSGLAQRAMTYGKTGVDTVKSFGSNMWSGARSTIGWAGDKAGSAASWAGGKLGLSSRLSGLGGRAMPLLRGAGGAIGKRLPLLGLALGGATGFNEAESVGTGLFKGEGTAGKIESTLTGALTGSADLGSIAGDIGLVEKHGTADKALGVAGAAGGGALTGMAIGTMIAPGIGTAIGGALGGILGGGAELWKLYWQEAPKDLKPTTKMTTSLPKSTVQSDMEAERIANQPAFAEVGSEELSTIATNSDEQTMLTARMIALLDSIDRSLQNGGGGGEEEVSNSSTSKPPGPTDYYAYPVGSFNQGANKGVTNIGIG